jgi:LAO/AO transport system kinase
MDKEKLTEKVKTLSKSGQISCKQALKLAEEEGISSRDLGDLLNEIKVKVMGCQLGCFP